VEIISSPFSTVPPKIKVLVDKELSAPEGEE